MKLGNQETMEQVNPAELSRKANAHFEALAFLEDHPEYLRCNTNQALFKVELQKLGRPPKYQDMVNIYEKLKDKLLTRQKVAHIMAIGTVAQASELLEKEGVERFDDYGRSMGKDFPDAFREPVNMRGPRENSAGRATKHYMQSIKQEHPEDEGYRPTKREFAGWTADRQREWLEASGYWGRDLPSFLR
jgi:hypothetical protein